MMATYHLGTLKSQKQKAGKYFSLMDEVVMQKPLQGDDGDEDLA